jgi:uncharacterized membrane protein
VAALAIATHVCATAPAQNDHTAEASAVGEAGSIESGFQNNIQPLLKKYCLRCHNVDNMESGIRVDQLNGNLEDRWLRLWQAIQTQITDAVMPPEDEPQPTAEQRRVLVDWIEQALTAARSRVPEKVSVHSNSRRVGCEWGVRWDAIARVARYAV